jgi:hypothetical protein
MPRPSRHLFLLGVCLAGLLLSAGTARALITINWGSSLNSKLYDSNNVKLGDAFSFDIGSFGSFLPDASNVNLWSANWHAFDSAAVGNGWNSSLGWIFSLATLKANSTSSESPPLPAYTFFPSQKGYLWAYNSKTVSAGTEWALITANDWTFPTPADPGYQLDWKLSTATTPIFGGLNNVQGPGAYSVSPPVFDLQTHQVPEPGSALLVAVAGLMVFSSRRRR